MIKNRIKTLREKFKHFNIDGYIIPKNDEFFSEYAENDRLKNISDFTGSAGLAIILKKKNYLFVDGRYTIQAQNESGKNFKIIEIHKKLPHTVIKNYKLGFDPNLFTSKKLKYYFSKKNKLISILNTNNNIGSVKEEGDFIIAHLKEEMEASEINTYLFKNGITVSHLVKRKPSLEEQFLNLTNNN